MNNLQTINLLILLIVIFFCLYVAISIDLANNECKSICNIKRAIGYDLIRQGLNKELCVCYFPDSIKTYQIS